MRIDNISNNSVLVGMSGGVDSSVAVGLILEEGYTTFGLTITPFKIDERCKIEEGAKSCCNQQSLLDAIEIAEKFGIPHYLAEMSTKFEETVVRNFVDEYMSGRTPNPCVICNPEIKWNALLTKADEIGAFYVSTGHYASIRYDEKLKRKILCKAKDELKDQTYFLWRLTKEQIERTLFPLGQLSKSETRELADRFALIVKNKPDSQEICFVPNNDYREFLSRYLDKDLENAGDFVFRDKVVGKHKGYPFYTVGQRKGLGLSHSEPLFVKSINSDTNTIFLETIDNLGSTVVIANDIVLSKYDSIPENTEYQAKIRYRDPGSTVKCQSMANGNLRIEFLQPKNSIAIGQSIVLYEGDDLIGGGIIDVIE